MRKWGLIAAAMIVLLSGCSSKFAYNNFDWMLYWYLDDYIELSDQQKDLFDQRLVDWLQWHRSEELANYRDHLASVKASVETGDVSQQDVLKQFERGREHWYRMRDKIAPQLIPMAQQLSEDQIITMFDALEEDNLEEEEDREQDAEKRLKQNIKRTKKQLKEWIGPLTKGQVAMVERYVPQFETNFDNWLSYRRAIQQAAKKKMLARDSDEFPQNVIALMQNPEAYQSAEYQRISETNRMRYAAMLSELESTLTKKQRRRLLREIDDVIDDLHDLIQQD